ncbi:MAG TPA: DoxX family protein [Cytophagales bacterium]|nr:DoxX family protein [Cytophagales bacterium]HCR54093.1 DoxX family protein [Cytophagales bacterium]
MNKSYTDAGLLVLRLGTGLFMAFGHGLGKLPPSDGLIENTGKMGFPLPVFFAWMAGLSEFLGGLLIALGLFTRPAAFLWICTMSTAAFIRHADDPFGSKEKALMYLIIGISFVLLGSGRYSLGKLLFKSDHPLL